MLSKGVKSESAFTKAEPSSAFVNAPVLEVLAAWNTLNRSAESASGTDTPRGGNLGAVEPSGVGKDCGPEDRRGSAASTYGRGP